jgi:hypothetical protein
MADKTKFPRCEHKGNCGCTALHSYLKHYSKLLPALSPERVFEWGPGLNTQVATGLPSVRRIVSVEQDKRWIPDKLCPSQQILNVKPSSPWYVHLWDMRDADVFFVDSRRRAECISLVHKQATKDTAVVCLHDAQRCRYHEALALFEFVHFYEKGFAAATRSSEIYEVIRSV